MEVVFHISGGKIDYSITVETTGWVYGDKVGSQPNSLYENHFQMKQMYEGEKWVNNDEEMVDKYKWLINI